MQQSGSGATWLYQMQFQDSKMHQRGLHKLQFKDAAERFWGYVGCIQCTCKMQQSGSGATVAL